MSDTVKEWVFEYLARFFRWALGPDAFARMETICGENVQLRRDLLDARRERDEARPIVEAAMRQYEAAAPCGWIGAWWLNPAFQTAAIQLHVTCEAAARAAEGGGDE